MDLDWLELVTDGDGVRLLVILMTIGLLHREHQGHFAIVLLCHVNV